MGEPNEFRAYFTVTGDFDPAEITSFLGLQPTESWRKSDVFGRVKKSERKFSRWSLGSRLPKEVFLEEHVKDVVVQLTSVVDKIAVLRPKWDAHVTTVAYFNESPSGFFFDAESISALGAMKLALDIDLYYLGEERDADLLQ